MYRFDPVAATASVVLFNKVNWYFVHGSTPLDVSNLYESLSGLSKYDCPAPRCHDSLARRHDDSGDNVDSPGTLLESACARRRGRLSLRNGNCGFNMSTMYGLPFNAIGNNPGVKELVPAPP